MGSDTQPANASQFINDKDDIDLGELLQGATKEILAARKTELSTKINKLFFRADSLAREVRDHEVAGKKSQAKLDNTLAKIDRLKSGDWSVVKELDSKDEASS